MDALKRWALLQHMDALKRRALLQFIAELVMVSHFRRPGGPKCWKVLQFHAK